MLTMYAFNLVLDMIFIHDSSLIGACIEALNKFAQLFFSNQTPYVRSNI